MGTTFDLREITLANDAFRREVETGTHSQLVVMTIPAGGGSTVSEARSGRTTSCS